MYHKFAFRRAKIPKIKNLLPETPTCAIRLLMKKLDQIPFDTPFDELKSLFEAESPEIGNSITTNTLPDPETGDVRSITVNYGRARSGKTFLKSIRVFRMLSPQGY